MSRPETSRTRLPLIPLNKFDVSEKDGGVYIKGKESDIKGGKRTVNIKPSSKGQEKVVIIGGGSGAFGTLLKLRHHGFDGKVTVITNEGLPIDRTKLSKALITDASKIHLNPQEWYDDGSIDFVDEEATSVDFSGKECQDQEWQRRSLHETSFGYWRHTQKPTIARLQKSLKHFPVTADIRCTGHHECRWR